MKTKNKSYFLDPVYQANEKAFGLGMITFAGKAKVSPVTNALLTALGVSEPKQEWCGGVEDLQIHGGQKPKDDVLTFTSNEKKPNEKELVAALIELAKKEQGCDESVIEELNEADGVVEAIEILHDDLGMDIDPRFCDAFHGYSLEIDSLLQILTSDPASNIASVRYTNVVTDRTLGDEGAYSIVMCNTANVAHTIHSGDAMLWALHLDTAIRKKNYTQITGNIVDAIKEVFGTIRDTRLRADMAHELLCGDALEVVLKMIQADKSQQEDL